MDEDALLSHVDELCAIARQAFAAGNNVTGIAAVCLAAQLVRLAKIRDLLADTRRP